MGTRGKFGFSYKGKYYIGYNHWDSYLSGLGVRLILEIIHADLDEWIKLLENIKEVSDDEAEPTPEEIKKLEGYADMSGCSKFKSWDKILELTQGSFYHMLHAGYLVNVNDYDVDEEFIYLLDLDNKVFRVQGVRQDEEFEKTIKLETEELIKCAIEWSNGDLDEDYDPEVELVERQETVKERLAREQRRKEKFQSK